ncbi:MAG: FISUMP domain-containing protein [Bacteroidales bacterium]
MNVQLRKSGFSYDIFRKSISDTTKHIKPGHDTISESTKTSLSFHRIDFNLIGSNPVCEILTLDPSSDYLNYYTTGTPAEGVTNVRSFKSVIYKNIYPNIDLEFNCNEDRHFKYNLVVHPGGDLKEVQLEITGPDIELTSLGSLLLTTSLGRIEEEIPLSYYQSKDTTMPVKVRFTRIDANHIGFSVEGKTTNNANLVIDPRPRRLWATYYGGDQLESSLKGCSYDNAGNVIMSGVTMSAGNIATSGAHQTIYGGNMDGFLVKFGEAGERFWGTYYGGSNSEVWISSTTDIAGNSYMSGETHSPNNISTPGSYQQVIQGAYDAFIAKFNSNGQRIWGTYYGGLGNETATFCKTDDSCHVYFGGETSSLTNIATPGSYQPASGGLIDGFLVKFDSSGQRIWATYYGGSNYDHIQDCSTLHNGIVFISGESQSTNGISSPGASQPIYGGGAMDTFLASFTSTGQKLWGTYYGGTLADRAGCCANDTNGNVYLTGSTMSTNNISTPGSFQTAIGGNKDVFLAKFNSTGSRVWGTYYGGSDAEDWGYCAVNDSGYVFICGATASSSNIASADGYQTLYGGGTTDAFLSKFATDGQRVWGTYYGDIGQDIGTACNIDPCGHLYLLGYSNSLNNISSPGAFQTSMAGNYDDFLVKFAECTGADPAQAISGPLTVCQSSIGIVYTVPPIAHASGYNWSLPAGFTITGGLNTNQITLSIAGNAVSGTISVFGTSCCEDGIPSSVNVIVHSRPLPSITGDNAPCEGEIKVYTTESGMSNYQWTFSSGGQQISGGTVFDDFIQLKWINSGNQWIDVNYTDFNSCSASVPNHFPVNVAVGTPVDISISESQNNVCPGTIVTFLATPTNPGITPFYQWKVNGINSGPNSSTFSYTPMNTDVVTCELTSSLTVCISNNPATSNGITMTVNPNLPVSITVTPNLNPVCAGTSVTFTSHPLNEGTLPSYEWKVNGNPVGANLPTYTYIPLSGDGVTCTVNSNATCAVNNPATSPVVTMTVNPNLLVSVSISSSSNPFCVGSSVTFTATPNNGGTPPSYQWKVNGIGVGPNNQVYSYFPNNGDVVTCVLNSNISCPIGNPATSNSITMIVNANLPAGVSITATPNPFCPGSSVTFNATPLNGGPLPAYQWKVNGANVGTNSNTYSYNPANGDSVRCVMTSNLACVTSNPASSAKIIMSGTLAPIVTFTSCFDTITSVNAKPFKLKGGIPLGGTYSGPGVNSPTGVFTPSTAGTGTKIITYSYTNVSLCSANKSRNIMVQAAPVFVCGNNLTDIRDNKIYPSVQIGSQCWMAKNLDYGMTVLSSLVQNDNCISEKYCYNDLAGNCTSFGGLYQWDEMMQFDDTPAGQGQCPPGWHVPTENEWQTLFNFYNGNGFAGRPLQDLGFNGFNALRSGVFFLNSSMSFNGFATLFWSSTPWGQFKALSHGMNTYNYSVSLYPSSRANAFPVRCLRD